MPIDAIHNPASQPVIRAHVNDVRALERAIEASHGLLPIGGLGRMTLVPNARVDATQYLNDAGRVIGAGIVHD
jgi:hypothetical protein